MLSPRQPTREYKRGRGQRKGIRHFVLAGEQLLPLGATATANNACTIAFRLPR
jgi:hypothetical protein